MLLDFIFVRPAVVALDIVSTCSASIIPRVGTYVFMTRVASDYVKGIDYVILGPRIHGLLSTRVLSPA